VALAKTATVVAIAKGAAASGSTLILIQGALKIMAWTKAKATVVACAIVLLAAGATTVVILDSSPYDPWENMDSISPGLIKIMNKFNARPRPRNDNASPSEVRKEIEAVQKYQKEIDDLFAEHLKNAPIGVTIRQTHFSGPNGGSAMHGDNQLIAKEVSFVELLTTAYKKPDNHVFSIARMVLPADFPAGKYDYIVNVTDHGPEKFQNQIKKQFGLAGHIETLETNALALVLKNPTAPGLQPNAQISIVGQGFFDADSLAQCLEDRFKQPVVDETKLPDTHSHTFIVPFKPDDLDSLKRTLLDVYGLELVPTNAPIEMLVVEKVK